MRKEVKMRAAALVLAALCALAFTGCGAESGEAETSDEISALLSAAPAEAAATPAECDGVGALQWGESYDALAERSGETETVQFDAEIAGFPAALFSRYSSAGKFYHGYYVFYETEELSGAEIFVGVRDYLLQTYGAADETESEATLESAVNGGESYTMLWTAQTSDGADINIQLRYGDNSSQIWSASHVTLSMFNPAVSQ
ncbi:MAG: hypothetical protein LUE15_05015 [Oscillospiraceae bacterium]|nr:hypothetical protein [Oscillospiraceae bacterium]